MALFKISKGVKANLPSTYNEGYCYFTTDDGKFYIDTTNTAAGRILLNAGKADQLSTARTISLTGDVTGSATFDGSNNISITATVANNSHNHSASNITSGTLAIARGGTGATTAADACKNLGAMYLDPNDTTISGEASTINAQTFSGMTYAQVKADILDAVIADDDGQTGVYSVNGKTGAVTLAASDVGALPTSGGTLTGSLTLANGTWNMVGDNVYIGDHNIAGAFCVKPANTEKSSIVLYNTDETVMNMLTFDGTNPTWNGNYIYHQGNKPTYSDVGAPSTTGTNASGSWPINITGTASFVDMISGTSGSSAVPLNDIGVGKIKYYYNVNNSLDGNMPAVNNANGILYLNTHSGEYGYQLGFSSNGNIYYRMKNGSAFINSTLWKALLSSDNFTSYVTPAAIGAAAASHTHDSIVAGSASVVPLGSDNTSFDGAVFYTGTTVTGGLLVSQDGSRAYRMGPDWNVYPMYDSSNLGFDISGTTLYITKY